MTLEAQPRTFRHECSTCHSPAQLRSDSDPLSLEAEQWYECDNGHITKNHRTSANSRR